MMSAEAISQVECSIIHLMCKTPLSSMDFHNVGCQSKTQQGTLTSKSTKIAYSKYCKGSWFLPYSSRPKAREPGPSGLAYMAQPPPRFLGQTRQKVDIYRPGYHVGRAQRSSISFAFQSSLLCKVLLLVHRGAPDQCQWTSPHCRWAPRKALSNPNLLPLSLYLAPSACRERERESYNITSEQHETSTSLLPDLVPSKTQGPDCWRTSWKWPLLPLSKHAGITPQQWGLRPSIIHSPSL